MKFVNQCVCVILYTNCIINIILFSCKNKPAVPEKKNMTKNEEKAKKFKSENLSSDYFFQASLL